MEGLSERQKRGLTIAAEGRVRMRGVKWHVSSQSRRGHYIVDNLRSTCTCPDFKFNGLGNCKHVFAVRAVIMRTIERLGDKVIETAKPAVRKTYRQNWPKYNAAQCQEKEMALELLRELCDGISEAPQKRGRPRMPMADLIFAAATKVYVGMSGRRASSDIRDATAKHHVDRTPHYNTVSKHLKDTRLTPVLKLMIEEASKPLRAVETQYSVDGTGFSTSNYLRWFDHKYGKPTKKRQWIKCHAMVGCRTNIITAVQVTHGTANDSPQMAALVAKTAANGFTVAEMSADKAYLSRANVNAISEAGGVPYIPFKSNSRNNDAPNWRKMWGLFWYRRSEFEKHYHQRSNVEATFSMLKRKFGGAVRSKLFEAQCNEVLLKCLVHNLAVLVHEIHELGVQAEFWQSGRSGGGGS